MKISPFSGTGLLAVLLTGSAVIGTALAHDGDRTSETRDLDTFERIVIDGSADVSVVVGGSQTVEVQTESDHLDLVTTEVRNNTLYISQERHRWRNTSVSLDISVANLSGVMVDGSGDFDVRNVDSDTFNIEIEGSGNVYVSGRSSSFDVEIDGSGDITLEGTCDSLVIDVDGSGDIDAEDLTCKSAEITLEGSGDIDVYASEAVTVDMSGSGDIAIYGDPDRVRPKMNGSGSFRLVDGQ